MPIFRFGCVVVVLVLAFGPSPARAQSGGGYMPLGAGGGGFVPYRGGPAGGFGMTPRSVEASSVSPPVMTPGRTGSSLGSARSAFPTLGPLGLTRGRAMGRGVGTRSVPSRSMRRPPVGSYPFRLPPSLFGPATSGAMGM